jgi:hypothetical protein
MVNRENEAGFHTAGFIGSFVLHSRFDFAQGFDHYDEDFSEPGETDMPPDVQRSAEAVTDAAIDYLDRNGVPDNLFLFVHYFDPHTPYNPPSPYGGMYGIGVNTEAVMVEDHPALLAG